MKKTLPIYLMLVLFSCKSKSDNISNKKGNEQNNIISTDSINGHLIDEYKYYWPKKDSINKDSLIEIIKNNFKEINQLKHWSRIESLDIEGESTEGAVLVLYFEEDVLRKFIVKHYYEMGQDILEFYMRSWDLDFIYVKETKYNTHFAEQDFDFNKSEFYEVRSYFYNNELIEQICSKDSNIREYDEEDLIFNYFYYIDLINEKSTVLDSLSISNGRNYMLLR